MVFGGFYFGSWGSLYHNDIHGKMVTNVTDRNGCRINTAGSVLTVANRTILEPTDVIPNLDYFRFILSKFQHFRADDGEHMLMTSVS